MTVPNQFANVTTSIPLSQLDANFNTPITLGNTAIQLGNTVTTLNNMTLANVTITSGNVTITNVTVTTANVTTANITTAIIGTANVTTANVTTGIIGTANVTTGNITTAVITTANVATANITTSQILNYGTANSVVYLNSSKAATANTGLQFDGTNLGLGVTPSAWGTGSSVKAFQNPAGALWNFGTNYQFLGQNYYFNSSNQRIYLTTAAASEYAQVSGQHQWFNAASGTAGNAITFTQAMTLTASGNLLVNATAAVINSNEAIGAVALNSTSPAISGKNSAGATSACVEVWNNATSGNNLFIMFSTETAYTTRGNIDYNRGAGQVRYNATSDATLKNIIGDSDGQRSLEILSTTRIREYAWKDDEQQKPQIGVIAQELYETYKGAVSVGGEVEETDAEGNVTTKYRPWGVDKTAFTFHLISGWQAHEKMIKEQQTMIDELKAKVAALENA